MKGPIIFALIIVVVLVAIGGYFVYSSIRGTGSASCPSSYTRSYNFEPRSSVASFTTVFGLNYTMPVALAEKVNGTRIGTQFITEPNVPHTVLILGPAQATTFSNMTQLELTLSISNSTAQPGQVAINASLFNTLTQANNVSGSQNWTLQGITGCRFPNSPGIAIFSGYYVEDNMSYYNSTYGTNFTTSPPLQIYEPTSPGSYGLAYFKPGVYTVLAEDEWGQELIAHFKVV